METYHTKNNLNGTIIYKENGLLESYYFGNEEKQMILTYKNTQVKSSNDNTEHISKIIRYY